MTISKNGLLAIVVGSMLSGVAATGDSGRVEVTLDRSPDRVETPLNPPLVRIGTLVAREKPDPSDDRWQIGCEVLDRDFANFDEYKRFLVPLGIRNVRFQGGWAKCERTKGVYDFSWLDAQVDWVLAHGLNPLIETSYGNPIYNDVRADLGGGFPSGEKALVAWDAWVDALTRHFKGRVRDWGMWNEPDNNPQHTPERVAAFNVRTARIVKRNIPDARVAGLVFNHPDTNRFDRALKAMGPDTALFWRFVYHSYEYNPESSYGDVAHCQALVKKYAPHAVLWQGENGAPSETVYTLALLGRPWSEYSQAKYNLRRMLGDLGRSIPSSVFTICDYNHVGRELGTFGLLRANKSHEVIGVKRAFYAVQNVATLFDSRTKLVARRNYSKDGTIEIWEYRRDGKRLYVFWDHMDGKSVPPSESFELRPFVMDVPKGAEALETPVWIDLLTGRIYEFPKERVLRHSDGITYTDIPLYDSPCVLTERLVVDAAMLAPTQSNVRTRASH